MWYVFNYRKLIPRQLYLNFIRTFHFRNFAAKTLFKFILGSEYMTSY